METINLYGTKGGVGTSVTAAALAIVLQGTLISPDADAILATMGGFPQSRVKIGEGPTVKDRGVLTRENTPPEGSRAILVTTCCYLALRSALSRDLTGFSGVIVVEEPGRALTSKDAAEILVLDLLAVIPRDPSIARSVDAGLLVSRLPAAIAKAIGEVFISA